MFVLNYYAYPMSRGCPQNCSRVWLSDGSTFNQLSPITTKLCRYLSFIPIIIMSYFNRTLLILFILHQLLISTLPCEFVAARVFLHCNVHLLKTVSPLVVDTCIWNSCCYPRGWSVFGDTVCRRSYDRTRVTPLPQTCLTKIAILSSSRRISYGLNPKFNITGSSM